MPLMSALYGERPAAGKGSNLAFSLDHRINKGKENRLEKASSRR